MLKLRITMEVVNEEGDVMNIRGMPSHLNRNGRLEAQRVLANEYNSIDAAHNALNQAWEFVNPIDHMLARR